MTTPVRIGIGLGRIGQWHDGIGEFVRRFAETLSQRAAMLRDMHRWELVYHLPKQWHGMFGDEVRYLDVHNEHRWHHRQPERFDLWHNVHLRSRVAAPAGTRHRVETVHDLIFLHAATSRLQAWPRRWNAQRRLQASDAIVAISHYVADDVRRVMAPLQAPVHVIHNGVGDLSEAAREPVAEVADRPFLLHISRMSPNKNIGALIELAGTWPEQGFVLAGQGNAHTLEVGREIERRGLSNVHLVLDVDDARKAWLYAQCQGFLFPSLDEGFGMPPIEAMYFGKPAFLSRLTSLPEIGGEVAYYFDAFDAARIRSVVEAGLQHAARPGAAEAIRAHACRFAWSRCIDEYVALYRRIIV